ncbi:DUF1344 domain-containing protein, partial [Dysosmobacter welbionis]
MAGLDLAGAHRLDVDRLHRLAVELGEQALHIQDDLRHVFLDTWDGGELMLHAGDLDGGRGRAGQRGKHNAAKRIAQSGAVAALQRFHHILAVCGVPRRLDALNLGL